MSGLLSNRLHTHTHTVYKNNNRRGLHLNASAAKALLIDITTDCRLIFKRAVLAPSTAGQLIIPLDII